MSTRTLEVAVSGEVIRIEGLQRDRRRRNDLRISLPDDRVVFAHGRRPAEEGWEVYFEDESGVTVGTDLGTSLAYLVGYDDPLDWGERFLDAIS